MISFPRILLAAAVSCTLLVAGGCSPKKVTPYAGSGNMPEGSASDSAGRMGNITEEMGSGTGGGMGGGGREGLDATGKGGLSFAGDQQVTPELLPEFPDHLACRLETFFIA